MNDPLREKLTWFRNNLDLLIEDHELEKQDISVDLYFDTLDVTHSVLGVETYFFAGTFDVKEIFQAPMDRPLRDRTLVLCLAFSGRLGPFKLLPPHQAEFLASLNRDFGVYTHLPPKQMVSQFLDAVSRTESVKKEASLLRDSDEEKTLEYVRQHAGSATNFFKILQLIRGVTWQERLVKLRRDRLLRLTRHDFDYEELLDSSVFHTLYKEFEQIREERATANFADAIALTMLTKKVEEIRKDNFKSIPRFFVSSERTDETPLFLTVINRAGLGDAFSYSVLNQSSSSVLRRSDYFVFKSTFQKPHDSKGKESGSEMTRPKELLNLRDSISSILEAPSLVQPQQLDAITFSGKKLSQVIDDLNTFLFFTNVWLPSSTQDVQLAVKDLKEAADELKSREFKRGVSEGIEAAKAILQENVIQYQLIRRMWLGVETAVKSLKGQWGSDEDIDYSRDFGLLRFAFPDSAYMRINQVLEGLLKGAEEGRLTHSNLIAACYLAHLSPTKNEKYVDDLAAAASVLWVAELYRQLVDLLSEVEPLPHYSLELILAAALSEMHHKETRGTRIINKLYRMYLKTKNVRERANLAVGLAYLYFHFWRRMGYAPSWDSDGDSAKRDATDAGRESINRSIKLALEAYNLLGDWDMKKKVYALNQYVYYLVMGGDKSSLNLMHDAANNLLRYKEQGDTEWWQHRFDDTLARYYYRLASSASELGSWDVNISTAVGYADEAYRRAPWDKVARTFRDRVRNRKERGFSKRDRVD